MAPQNCLFVPHRVVTPHDTSLPLLLPLCSAGLYSRQAVRAALQVLPALRPTWR